MDAGCCRTWGCSLSKSSSSLSLPPSRGSCSSLASFYWPSSSSGKSIHACFGAWHRHGDVFLILFFNRRPSAVNPTADPNVLQEAANQVAQAAAKQLVDYQQLHPMQQQHSVDDSKLGAQRIVVAEPTVGQEANRKDFQQPAQQQQMQYGVPSVDAMSLMQRLYASGQPEAALAVASASGLNPSSVPAGGGSLGMPSGGRMPAQGQYGPSLATAQQQMVPYAPIHTVYS